MAMESKDRDKLEEFVERLRSYRARHTELITVYVPKGFDINLITKQLESEKSTAANIKSTGTRKNVQDALESLVRICKSMRVSPPNGIVLFAGNVSQTEGQADFVVEQFEPPEELNIRLYRCDQTFVMEPLEEMLEIKDVYGLFVIDLQEATIGLLIGKKIKILQKVSTLIPGKTKKGGQCLSPDTSVVVNGKSMKLSDIKVNDIILGYDFEDKEANETLCINKWDTQKNKIIKISFDNGNSIIASEDHLFFVYSDNMIIEKSAGKLTKDDKLLDESANLVNIDDIDKEEGIYKLIDIETKNHNFIANGLIVHNSSARYARIRENIAKEFYRKMAEMLKTEFSPLKNKLKGILIGGPGPTKEYFLKEGQLITTLEDKILAVKDIGYANEHGIDLLVEESQDILANQDIIYEKKILEKFFNMLGKQRDKTAYGREEVEKAMSFGAVEKLYLSKKLDNKVIKEFEKKADETSVDIEMISVETEEGQQFWNLSGIGAILRFKI